MPGTEFAAKVHEVILATNPGDVLTYGQVAALAGRPGAARAVGATLAASTGLPWWRVVQASGRLATGKEAEQARRLAAEGVPVRGDRVSPPRSTGRPV
ncbi:MAG: hypothetical protein AVDCRST_MAG50-1175 [uncultured Acidimicrobiales bacterium]|uniref:Methylated-DNA-[protein]-cysteine S-methyltransferase DNA binding domain-containing protein n=1 Tax=uncultured Acidimicrobiales bacterium TaxID=310071 RepID=A0A6J4HSG1_9ACTN|nr:MAG: hypothetical protein AVDCRST_MAG50-1175 [uncultured Acidimicrobiales bacterium]